MPNRKTPARRRSSGPGDPPHGPSELILYTTPDLQTRIEVRLEDETVKRITRVDEPPTAE